jgi:hypothetical protein
MVKTYEEVQSEIAQKIIDLGDEVNATMGAFIKNIYDLLNEINDRVGA